MRLWLVLAIVLAGCEPAPPAPPAKAATAGPPNIAVVPVVAKALSKTLTLPGEILPFRDVAIYPRVSGFVEKIEVDRGSPVKQGQLLVQLVAPELHASRLEAEARRAADEATFKRLKEAAATPGVVSKNDLEIAEKAAVADAERVKGWQQQEAYLRIGAPFDGIVTERNVHEGSLVAPSGAGSAPMLRVQELSRLRLVIAVPEPATGGIAEGNEIKFAVPAYPGVPFAGKIARVAHALEVKTRTMPVELDVDNAGGKLAPGMFAEVKWPMKRAEPTLFVPASAIATTTERTFVIRMKDMSEKEAGAEWVDVRPGVATADGVEVFGSLSAGDWVAARATDELRAGTKVLPSKPTPPK